MWSFKKYILEDILNEYFEELKEQEEQEEVFENK